MSKRILEILIEEKFIDEAKKEIALQRQIKMGGKIGGHLLALGYIDPVQLSQILSKKLNTPEVDPSVLDQIDKNLLMIFPIHLAKKYIALPLIKIQNTLSIVLSDPTDARALRDIQSQIGYKIKPFIAPESIIKQKIVDLYKIDSSFLKEKSGYVLSKDDVSLIEEMYDYQKKGYAEAYIPSTETYFPDDFDSENSKEPNQQTVNKQDTSNYQLIAAPDDQFVLGLTTVRSIEEFCEEIVRTLFLGLDRIAVFEIYGDKLAHITSKNWIMKRENLSLDINQKSINFYVLLQENFFHGDINDVVTPEVSEFLIDQVVEDGIYNVLFMVLSYNNSPFYLIFGEINGQPVPDAYSKKWKELQPKFETALKYLVKHFEIEGSL